MNFVSCSKDKKDNISSLSNDYSYIINKKNKLIYYSTEKGVSLEYIVDKNFKIDDKGIFIYEDFGNIDTINIIFINDIQKSINFTINKDEKNFSIKKIENLIKAICIQSNINHIYYFENSNISNNISLPLFVRTQYKSRKDFRKIARNNGKLKNNQNKIVFLVAFCVATLMLEFGMNQSVSYLSDKSRGAFNKNYSALENKKNNLLIELQNYENLSQNLKDITVASSKEAYIKIKSEEMTLPNNEVFPQ